MRALYTLKINELLIKKDDLIIGIKSIDSKTTVEIINVKDTVVILTEKGENSWLQLELI